MINYFYKAEGEAADGQTWITSGNVFTEQEGNFHEVPMMAMEDSFLQLTKGKAVFGFPGLGCRGPYKIMRLLLERTT